jgi:hypothetical protein
MKRFPTALAAAMLVGASLQAPFAHVHPEDPDHHHATGFVHDHLAVHEHHDAAEGPELEPHDDNELAIFLEFAPAAAQRVAVTYVQAPSTPGAEPVMVLAGSAPEFTPRANSPPAVRLRPARAPPV